MGKGEAGAAAARATGRGKGGGNSCKHFTLRLAPAEVRLRRSARGLIFLFDPRYNEIALVKSTRIFLFATQFPRAIFTRARATGLLLCDACRSCRRRRRRHRTRARASKIRNTRNNLDLAVTVRAIHGRM